MSTSQERFEGMKQALGMASHGTTEYFRNAAKILSQWATPDGSLRADTQAKLEALACSSDPETSAIARAALAGHAYSDGEDYFDPSADTYDYPD